MRSFACVLSVLLCFKAFAYAQPASPGRLVRDVRADGSIKDGSVKPIRMHNQGDADLVTMSVGSDAETSVEEEAALSAGSDDGAIQYLMGSKVHDILMEVEDMVRNANTTAPAKEKLQVIKDIVTGTLMPDLVATRLERVTQVGVNKAAIDSCNSVMTARVTNISLSTEKVVTEARTNHSTCREAEKGINSTKGSHCKKLDDWLNGIVAPATLPNPKKRDSMVEYVKAMSTYFCPKGDEVTAMNDACTAATNNHTTHKGTCDAKQDIFELAVCTWRDQWTDACTTQSTCYSTEVTKFNTYKTQTEGLVHKWKLEYAALQKIICFLDVWLENGDVNTVSETKLNHCHTHTVDTSSITITFPAVPAKATCALSDVPGSKYPGTDGFKAEYSSFSGYVKTTTACLAPMR